MTAPARIKQRGAFDADEAEIRAIRGGSGSISAGIQDELLSGQADDLATDIAADTPFKLPVWEQEQTAAESLAGGALEVANQRQTLLGNLYPFDLDRGSITYVERNPFYSYLLATSIAASRPEKEFQSLVREFERVVCALLISFAGGDARGIRIGWPSERGLDRVLETNISRRVERMKSHCGFGADEWTLGNDARVDRLRRRAKDARIDIVIRRSMGDSRCGGLSIIGQCGCGKNDVDESSRKHEELSQEWLNVFFDKTSVPRPIKVFATSQHIVDDDELYIKQSVAQAIVIDRVRLCLLAAAHPAALTPHITRIKTLTATFLNETSVP